MQFLLCWESVILALSVVCSSNGSPIHDFIITTHDWLIIFVVVDTRKWLPGKRVLIVPKSIKMISWTERRVHISLTSEEIKNSPEFDPNKPVDPQIMTMFSD